MADTNTSAGAPASPAAPPPGLDASVLSGVLGAFSGSAPQKPAQSPQAPAQIDYAALAKQSGAIESAPPPAPGPLSTAPITFSPADISDGSAPPPPAPAAPATNAATITFHPSDIDYNALAKQYGAIDSAPPPATPQPSASGKTGKALVPVMGGGMMEMDVPAGHESSTEQSASEGYQTGGKIGAGLVGTAAVGAGVDAAFAPTATAETVGTGILDAAGEEIMREGIKYGPSALARAVAHPIGKEILSWAIKGGASAVGGGAVWKALKMLGIL